MKYLKFFADPLQLFLKDTPTVVQPPSVPTITDPAIEEARKKAAAQARLARGRSSTILTGGQGVTGAAPVEKPTLMGA